MKLVVAAVCVNFDIYVVDDSGIEQRDHMIARPVADNVLLGFKRVPQI
jgi:hypothetical protein